MRNILILGAYSGIAQEAARCFAKDGDSLVLAGRDAEKLKILAQDLKARGAQNVHTISADLNQTSRHAALLKESEDVLGGLDTVLLAYGTFADPKQCARSYEAAKAELDTNFLSAVSWLILLAENFEEKKQGTIGVITSVAGDRGRASNYTYGAAKGALTLYLQGLRGRLIHSNVSVVTIKPGFVDTPMTAGLKKGPLFASAETAGRGVYQAMLKKKDVVYVPGFWRYIMLIIKLIPEFIFKKLPL